MLPLWGVEGTFLPELDGKPQHVLFGCLLDKCHCKIFLFLFFFFLFFFSFNKKRYTLLMTAVIMRLAKEGTPRKTLWRESEGRPFKNG
jgi:hypothetical protein